MALANYTDLLASIAAWLNRTDLTAAIPDFVSLAEERIARDLRLRKQVVNTMLTTVAGVQSVTLPADFLEAEKLSITSTTPHGSMTVVTPEFMDRRFPNGYQTGKPVVYTMLGDVLQLGPTPDAAYTISLDYYQRMNIAATLTNWLLTKHPSVYLNGCLVEASVYLMDVDKAQAYDTRYRAAVDGLQMDDDTALRSGSAMRVRAL